MRAGLRSAWGLVTVALTVSGSAHAAAKKTAAFNVSVVNASPGGQVTVTSKVWITPTQARAEVTDPVNGNEIWLVSNGSFYRLSRGTKRGIKAPLPPAARKSSDNFAAFISQFTFDAAPALKHAKKIRSESVAGYPCDVMTASEHQGSETLELTVWMPQRMDPKFPLKAVRHYHLQKPGMTQDDTVTITLSNVQLNTPMSPSLFAVPTGYKIKAVSQAARPGMGRGGSGRTRQAR